MTEMPHFGILKPLKQPLHGLNLWGSRLSQSAKSFMESKNYKDKLFNSYLNNKPIVWLIVVFLVIGTFAKFFDDLGTIRDVILYPYNLYIRFENKEMTDGELIIQSRALAKEISQYIQDRKTTELALDFSRFNESVEQMTSYTSETVGYYYSEFQPKTVQYRQEYLKRGLKNKDVDDLYNNPTNPIGIQSIASGLNDLSAQLQVKQK